MAWVNFFPTQLYPGGDTTSFSGDIRKKIYAAAGDFGTKIFSATLYVGGRSYTESGYRWLGPTDILLYRNSEFTHEIESLLEQSALTKVYVYRNGSSLGDFKSLFSRGCNNQYLLPYGSLIAKGCYGGKLGSTGTYSMDVYTIVHIDTMWYEVALTSVSMP